MAEKWRVQKSFWNTTLTWEVRPVSSNDQLRIPDSRLCAEVTELVRESSPEYLFNHSLRSFYFASLLAERRKTRLDVEVLYLGTIMHDIGLVEGMIHEPRRFEVVGADFARSHLLEQGLDEGRADVVGMAPQAEQRRSDPDRAVHAFALFGSELRAGVERPVTPR